MVHSPAQFIDTVGVEKLHEVTGRTEGAIRVWKHRNMFPRDAWLELNKAFPTLTLDVLKRFDEEYRERRRAEKRDAAA
jgi:hypothetical protein